MGTKGVITTAVTLQKTKKHWKKKEYTKKWKTSCVHGLEDNIVKCPCYPK